MWASLWITGFNFFGTENTKLSSQDVKRQRYRKTNYYSVKEVWLRGKEMWLTGKEVWLRGKEVWLTGKEVWLIGKEVWLRGKEVWLIGKEGVTYR